MRGTQSLIRETVVSPSMQCHLAQDENARLACYKSMKRRTESRKKLGIPDGSVSETHDCDCHIFLLQDGEDRDTGHYQVSTDTKWPKLRLG